MVFLEEEYAVIGSKRAARLKQLRKMAGLSRRLFSERHGVAVGTLQNWETARFGGLSEKGARVMLAALRKEGVVCNYEWLMTGVGSGPVKYMVDTNLDSIGDERVSSMEKDVAFFKGRYPSSKSYCLRDDSMSPLLNIGDEVVALPVQDVQTCLGRLCLIDLTGGISILRYVKSIDSQVLSCFAQNMQSRAPMLFVDRAEYSSISAVIWCRLQNLV